jgi:hypothetical protein
MLPLWMRQNRAEEGDGGDEEDRTPDLRIANAALSQLSYVPTALKYSQRPAERKLARRRGATGIAV